MHFALRVGRIPTVHLILVKTKSILRFAATALAAASFLGFTACNSTSVDDTWTAPDVSKLSFKKIMVVATFPDGATRRIAEDELKAQVTRAECITSYSLLGSESDLKDLTKVIGTLKAAGIDGVVIMRPVSDQKEITYIPGSSFPRPYRTFGDYYSREYALGSFYYEPGRYATDRVVQIETNIYEVAGERLVWSGATTSMNPGNVQNLIKDAANAIREKLVAEKLLPSP